MKIKSLSTLSLFLLLSACGMQESSSDLSIVGGDAVATDDDIMKSTVALVSPEGRSFCTGSLIGKKFVVTAGHCLAGYRYDSLYLAFGPKALPGHFARERLRSAVKASIHEKFDMKAMRLEDTETPPRDIALLEMDEDAPDGFVPVPVMTSKHQISIGEKLILAGYGITGYRNSDAGTLLKVNTVLKATNPDALEFDFGPTPGRSACKGDSGGPAFVIRGGELALLGVTSRGNYCTDSGIYTDIRYFIDWLVDTAKK